MTPVVILLWNAAFETARPTRTNEQTSRKNRSEPRHSELVRTSRQLGAPESKRASTRYIVCRQRRCQTSQLNDFSIKSAEGYAKSVYYTMNMSYTRLLITKQKAS